MREIIEFAYDAFFAIDPHGRIADWNRTAARMFGWPREEAIGRSIGGTIVPERFAATHEGTMQEYIDTGGGPVLGRIAEIVGLRRTGEEFPMEITVHPLPTSEGVVFCVFARDITVRKLNDENLQRLSIAVEQSPVGIMFTDLEGKIQYANQRYCELCGYAAEELYGQKTSLVKSGNQGPDDYKVLWREITAGRTWRGELQNRRKNGELYWVDATISPIRNKRGEPVHFITVQKDITARKSAQEQLLSAKAAAEAAARAKSEFLATMSHEIRTPMNGVLGMISLLLDTQLNPEQREFAQTVRTSAENLLGLLNDILDFSKIEAGKLTFENLDFDLIDTVETTLDMFAESARAKGIELVSIVAGNVPALLRGDPSRLRQVLINLLGNALKFTERGHVGLRIAVEREEPANVTLRFSVSDTGIGIPEEIQRRLFHSFTQADASTTRRFGGTGLGLAIAKQLVTRMGGYIGVKSESGKGATFSFNAQFALQPGAPSPQFVFPAGVRRPRVFIVDDNAAQRGALADQLSYWEIVHEQAGSSVAAIQQLRRAAVAKSAPDIVLLDAEMPAIDGQPLRSVIKADPLLAGLRLILLTPFGRSLTRKPLDEEQSISKPIRQSRLFEALRTFDQRGGNAQPAVLSHPGTGSETKLSLSRPLRVLVAEDNQVNQRIAALMLKKIGCVADVVADGSEVLVALQRGRYDVVLMDCQMPVMDGFDTTRAIRECEAQTDRVCPWHTPLPIVAVTANAMQGDREKCLAAGMSDYISKPMNESALRAILQRLHPPPSPS